MNIILSSDTSIDLPKNLLEKFNISTIAFPVSIGNEEFKDGDLETKVLLEKAKESKTLAKTGSINEYEYEQYFNSLLEKGDAVIHLSLSSKLSSTTENAFKAGLKIDNVFVIDTLNGSGGLALLAFYARKLIDNNEKIEDIVRKINDRIGSIQNRFIISKTENLYRGGRCSKLQLIGANLLKIRPVVICQDGVVKCDKKYRGKMEECVLSHFSNTLSTYNHPDFENAIINYTTCDEPQILEKAEKLVKAYGFKNVFVCQMNATISSHLGQNSFGISYFNI